MVAAKMVFGRLNVCPVFLLVLNFCWTRAEVFTAISDVEPLLQTHKRIMDDVNHYIASEEQRLIALKKSLNMYQEEHKKAMEDIPNYLGNPINAFTLIKRLTVDLDLIRQNIINGTENMRNITTNHEDVKYPAYEDLTGAAQALTRLQETYKLDVSELSKGVLNGVIYSTPMTAADCYELAMVLYKAQDYKDALPWFNEALKKYKEENEHYQFTESDILEFIGATHFYTGDTRTALEYSKKTLAINPKNIRAADNIILYQKSIAEEEAKQLISQISGETEEKKNQKPLSYEDIEYQKELKNYEILCRGEMDVPPAIAKSLFCRYLTENHPFLKLARIKVEYRYLEPDIMIFHDVMSDDEIEFIKETAQPRFRRAVVVDAVTGESVPVKYRISKSAWLEDHESRVIARISQRVADMTGLSMDTAEHLQVVNYGIGGHYEPHFDFSRKHESLINYLNAGNRIGTVLFYMSDVAQGGATVFTKLGVSLFPIKGAAAFWYNLHPSCEGDLATRHAACPVLRGSKWVSNKWIHQGGQELLRPCGLQYQEEGVSRRIPKPILKTSR
ncbi:prolyl 4-hydroxylase subunit alpha-1-like [Ostrinia furnacalis]|uniref:prolyl 4-hydroxylase subunit alpha-1-like n=1 Tax=Ostrinia furnacalis TaxID=93504 RepID=UPI0010407E94|nr:prolyl 4-hydroxylase subunit alpha-1-like [Ostrinia furnacalis]